MVEIGVELAAQVGAHVVARAASAFAAQGADVDGRDHDLLAGPGFGLRERIRPS